MGLSIEQAEQVINKWQSMLYAAKTMRAAKQSPVIPIPDELAAAMGVTKQAIPSKVLPSDEEERRHQEAIAQVLYGEPSKVEDELKVVSSGLLDFREREDKPQEADTLTLTMEEAYGIACTVSKCGFTYAEWQTLRKLLDFAAGRKES